MDARIQEEWCAIMEHGGLPQVEGELTDGTGFCCLGLLCEMAKAEGIVVKRYGGYGSEKDIDDWSVGALPKAVMEWAGIDSNDPTAKYQKYTLVALNDERKKTFPQIAKIVRRGIK